MQFYYLSAATAAELCGALDAEDLFIESETGSRSYYGQTGDYSLDWVGAIYEQTGVDEEGAPIMTAIAGAHCNIYSAEPLPLSLEAYLVDPAPATPHRVLAGY